MSYNPSLDFLVLMTREIRSQLSQENSKLINKILNIWQTPVTFALADPCNYRGLPDYRVLPGLYLYLTEAIEAFSEYNY
jgi:hypothetical protein